MANPKPDPDPKHDRDHGHDNDNGNDQPGKAVTPAPAGGALISLEELAVALNRVDTTSIVGSNMPLMQFKNDDGGMWVYGRKQTVVEDASRWGVNPLSYAHGYVCFHGKQVLGERLASITKPMPDATTLPDKGFPWQKQWCVNLKCLSGADAGAEVVFKSTTVGGIQALAGLLNTVRERLNGGQHDGKASPIVLLHKDSYQHPEHGRVWFPVLDIVDWMAIAGPAPAPTSTPPSAPTTTAGPAPQPRRRRVG